MFRRKLYLVVLVGALVAISSYLWFSGSPEPSEVLQYAARVEAPSASRDSDRTAVTPGAEGSNSNAKVGRTEGATALASTRAGAIVDWGKYPGSLSDQVSKALSERNPEMAGDLAAKMRECESIERSLSGSEGNRSGVQESVELQRVRQERLVQEQRLFAGCQTLPRPWKEVRRRLLDVALSGGELGAASELFALGVQRPELLRQT